MGWPKDKEAYCLANTYNFSPPRAVYPARTRNTNAGKYEPYWRNEDNICCMILAHYADKTNILIKYDPTQLQY